MKQTPLPIAEPDYGRFIEGLNAEAVQRAATIKKNSEELGI